MIKYLHITDYDDTISPKVFTSDTKEKEKHIAHYKEFIKNHPEIGVVYSSGRVVREIKELIETFDLPRPKYIIGSIGGEIYDYEQQTFIKEWDNYLTTSKNWDNKRVREIVTSLNIELQEEEQQHYYKVCSYLDNAEDDFLSSVKKVFVEENIPINLIYSSKKYLDVIPDITNKGKAGVFLAKYAKINLNNVAISGDSFNDIDMFKENFGLKIAPKNAEPKLLSIIKKENNFYLATKNVAFGTVEGLEKFLKEREI